MGNCATSPYQQHQTQNADYFRNFQEPIEEDEENFSPEQPYNSNVTPKTPLISNYHYNNVDQVGVITNVPYSPPGNFGHDGESIQFGPRNMNSPPATPRSSTQTPANTPMAPPHTPTSSGKKRKPYYSPQQTSSATAYHSPVRGIVTQDEQFNEPPPSTATTPVPEGSTPKRCFRLNLHDNSLYNNAPPALTLSLSEESSSTVSTKKAAVATAQIFRGLSVKSDGTIVSKYHKNRKSSKNNPNVNTKAQKSRQVEKIDKLKELVENGAATSDATSPVKCKSPKKSSKPGNNTDKDEEVLDPTNMLSLVVMGEYNDLKLLVNDGAKKLQRVEKGLMPEHDLTGVSHSHKSFKDVRSRMLAADHHSKSYQHLSPTRAAGAGGMSVKKRATLSNPELIATTTPPKLKAHPRDTNSSSRRHFFSQQCAPPEAFGFESNNWSELLVPNSIWNCVGSPTHAGAAHHHRSTSAAAGAHSIHHHMEVEETRNDDTIFEGADGQRGGGDTNQRDSDTRMTTEFTPPEHHHHHHVIT